MHLKILWKLIQDTYIFIMIAWLIITIILRTHRHYKAFLTVSTVVYTLVLFYVTLLGRKANTEYRMELSFLWEYRLALQGNIGWWIQIFDNILLFVPMGWLYSAMRESKDGLRKEKVWWKVIFFGVCASLAIELCQLVFKLGLFEFDDILNNTIGMMVGYWLHCLLERNRKYKCNT